MIFLFLIGFTSTAAELISDLIKLKGETVILGLTAPMFNLIIFLTIIGTWAGAYGSRKVRDEPDTWKLSLLAATLAGLVNGVLIAILAYIVGDMTVAGLKLYKYLTAVLPGVVNLFLLDQTPLGGAIFHLIFFSVTGLMGGVLGRGVGRGDWRKRFSIWWNEVWSKFNRKSAVQRVRTNPITRYVLYGLLLLIVFLLPLRIGQYWNYTLGTVGIYVLLGLGLNIVVGLAGLLDLGYVAFFAIGAYSVALLTAPEPHHLLWSFWVALPIGIALAALAGILLGIPVLRMRGDYLAIVTLGFGEIIRILSKSDLLTPFSGGPKGVINIAGPTLFGKPFSSDIDFVYLILLAVFLVIFVTLRLQNSRVGRAWEAMREDETVAQAMGINTLKHKLMAFAIGAAFAGLGGVLFASRNQFTGPEDHNLMVSINVLSVVIVGGMGSIPGVIAGAFALKGLPEVLRQLENYRVLAFGALLVVMMIVRPEGLIPTSRRRLETRTDAKVSRPERQEDDVGSDSQ
jgi:branched-chain amino acid transport system permease protein